jgi:hypothetical protein
VTTKNVGGTDPVLIYARPAYGRPGTPFLVANLDEVNPIYYGHDLGVDATSSQIPALGSVGFDGSQDMWASTLNPAIKVLVDQIPGGLTWAPSPAQVAIQLSTLGLAKDSSVLGLPGTIATTGVPLLSKPTIVGQPAGTIGASATVTPISSQPVSQTGYEIAVSLQVSAAATDPGVLATLTWTDSVSGQTVASEQWILGAASAAAQLYCGTGPTKGDTLTITLQNLDPAQSVTYSLSLTQNSRLYVRDDWRQLTNNAVPGQTVNASANPAANLLLSVSTNVAASTAISRLIPLYAGRVTFNFQGGNAGSQLEILTAFGAAAFAIYTSPLTTIATQEDQVQVDLPREQCVASIFNGAGGLQPMVVTAVISEQLP